ncbi:MAG: VanZ family protein [Planctomycetota bacterium]
MRRLFAAIAAVMLLLVIYASALPVRFVPISWTDLWTRFVNTPWLSLGLDRRADWVANGLILIPFGFFYAAAWDWPSSSFGRKQLAFVSFAIVHAVIVCFIEAMQICFPPRTVSLNDMLAGYVGGIFGIFLWFLTGNRIIQSAAGFLASPKGPERLVILARWCAFALVLYATMPLDVMLATEEWQLKHQSGGFVIVPFADWAGATSFMKSILMNGWALPFGVLLKRQYGDHNRAIQYLTLWCVVIELASLPIYTGTTSITDTIVRLTIGIVGVFSSDQVFRYANKLDRPWIWFAASLSVAIVTYVAFLARYETVITDHAVVMERVQNILVAPFARAQQASELVAAQNIAGKLILFAALGFLLSGWRDRQATSRPATGIVVASSALGLGITIEVSQAFLSPFVPDITDVLTYLVGAMVGLVAFRLLIPEANSKEEAPGVKN